MQSTSDLDCTASGRFPFSPFNVQPANRVDLEITLDQKSLKLTRFINSKARYRSLIFTNMVSDDVGTCAPKVFIHRAGADSHWLLEAAVKIDVCLDKLSKMFSGGFEH